ncbi:PPC domain-containing DNA-binding protein [Metabacillus herbersteinensis]
MTRKNHSFKVSNTYTIYGSLAEGTDLMEGILDECEKHNIRSGVVTCIGSLKKVGYVLFKAVNGLPSGYGRDIAIENPVELVNCTGFICEDENNNLDLHLHGLVAEEDGTLSAGHFLRGKNPTLITVEFSITYGNEIRASRSFDQDLGFKVINFSK